MANNYTDAKVQLIINKMTETQYEAAKTLNLTSNNELFLVEEENLNGENKRVISVATPTADTDAANKKYVDDKLTDTASNLSVTTSSLTGAEVLASVGESNGKIFITKRTLEAKDINNISNVICAVVPGMQYATSSEVSTIASGYATSAVAPILSDYVTSAQAGTIAQNKINDLDVTTGLSAAKGKMVDNVTETNGKVSVTYRDLTISEVSGLTNKLDNALTGVSTTGSGVLTAMSKSGQNVSGTFKDVSGTKSVTLPMNAISSISQDAYGQITAIGTTHLLSAGSITLISAAGGTTDSYVTKYTIKVDGVTVKNDKNVDQEILIPKDKVVESAAVVKFDTNAAAVSAIGTGATAGTYLKLTIANQTTPVYVAVPTLVNTYAGKDTSTISMNVTDGTSDGYQICAAVINGSIGQEHLTDSLSTEIHNIEISAEQLSIDIVTEAGTRAAADEALSAEISALSAASYTIESEAGTGVTNYKLMQSGTQKGSTIVVPNDDKYQLTSSTTNGITTWQLQKQDNGTGNWANVTNASFTVSAHNEYRVTSTTSNNKTTYKIQKQTNGTGNWTDVSSIAVQAYTGSTGGDISVGVSTTGVISAKINSGVITPSMLTSNFDYTTSGETSVIVGQHIAKLSTETGKYLAGNNQYISAITETSGVVSAAFGTFAASDNYRISAYTPASGKTRTTTYTLQKQENGTGDWTNLTSNIEVQKYAGSIGGDISVGINDAGVISAVIKPTYKTSISTDISNIASAIASAYVDPMTTSAEVSTIIEGYNYTRTYADGVRADLSVQHIDATAYAALLSAGTTISNVVYIVSSDTQTNYGKTLEDVADPVNDTDAANKEYVDTAVEDAVDECKVIIRTWTGTPS